MIESHHISISIMTMMGRTKSNQTPYKVTEHITKG